VIRSGRLKVWLIEVLDTVRADVLDGDCKPGAPLVFEGTAAAFF
jgi:hypothetical protein